MAFQRAEQLTALYDAHAARLMLYARQWLDPPSAEDAVQDVFLRLTTRKHASQDDDDATTVWLFRQVRAAASGQRRSLFRRRRREQRAAQARPPWFEQWPGDRLDAQSAERAMAELPEAQREAIVLRIWGGLTLAEMSQVLGEPVSTLFSRYRAALEAMRVHMEKSWETTAMHGTIKKR